MLSEDELKAIEKLNEILKEWQEIVNIEDKTEREIEMSLYMEDMPFEEIKTVLNLITKLQKENEIKIKGFEKEELICSKFTEKVGKDIIDYKFEYENNQKIIDELQKENEEKDEKIRNFENECMKFKSFCRRIRRDGHDVDLFNQGQEHKCNQFLNLINGEPYWDYKGKYFDDTDNQIKKYLGIERRNEGC